MYEYKATIERVVDGDTLWLLIELGFDVQQRHSVRLAGINCPELKTPEGQTAKEWVISQGWTEGTEVIIRTTKDRAEKFGRYLVTVFLRGAIAGDLSLNQLLVNAGHAVEYGGGKR